MNTIERISNHFFKHIEEQFSPEPHTLHTITVTLNTDEHKQNFGDLSSNAALILAKAVGKSPREIAQTITNSFKHSDVAKLEIAGPGFINFFLTPDALRALAAELAEQRTTFFKPEKPHAHNYSLEFVSANPTGPLHIGHGRGGIIGDVLGNILSFLGNSVTKEFYINDAGSQIEKLGKSLKIRCLQTLGGTEQLPEDAYHGEYLIELAQQCINEHGSNVINNDETFFGSYGKQHLLEKIKVTLASYGIHFNVWFSEKTLHESGEVEKAIALLTQTGHTYEKDGALWFTSQMFGDDKDRVLKKADGSYTYVAADVAYMLDKIERGADKLIMILGQDHHSYVVRLKGLLQALGNNPDMLDIILYQLVTVKKVGESVRLSKRAGNIVTLSDIIETVGKDVARFFYLNKKADAHLDFDIDLALKKTDENPVYYIQYAYVRTNSILQKAQEIAELSSISEADAQHITETESLLLKKIITLKDLLQSIEKNNQTHALSYYVIELAQQFHSYYSKHKVIDPNAINQSRGRLLMVSLVRSTLELCLDLLGIDKPEKM